MKTQREGKGTSGLRQVERKNNGWSKKSIKEDMIFTPRPNRGYYPAGPLWKHRSRCIAQIDIRNHRENSKNLHPEEMTMAGLFPSLPSASNVCRVTPVSTANTTNLGETHLNMNITPWYLETKIKCCRKIVFQPAWKWWSCIYGRWQLDLRQHTTSCEIMVSNSAPVW